MSKASSSKKIPLDGRWEFCCAPEGELDAAIAQGSANWMPGAVPGTAQLDLLENGLIADPFVGRNAEDIRRYEYFEWCYRTEFWVPEWLDGDRYELLFFGLDTVAEVHLNGHILGTTGNMFVPHSFDVTDMLVKDGRNDLLVRIKPALYHAAHGELDGCYCSMGTYESLRVRKARHGYGWDIAPRLVTAGIWRSVDLIAHGAWEVDDVFVRTVELSDDRARLVFHVSLSLPRAPWDELIVGVVGRCGDQAFAAQSAVNSPRVDIVVEVPQPRLWWPSGYGAPSLYDVEVTLYRFGVAVHTLTDRIGIRTVRLEQTAGGGSGGRFTLLVNEQPVFCKGTNSVPMDAIHSRDLGRIPAFVDMLKDTNCNTVRMWGGGVYENDQFFDLCDETGILVIQDFMYACAIYPQDDEFLMAAEREARIVVKSLRNHPCLVLWCGDNENDLAYVEWYDQSQSPQNNRLTREILPTVCQNYDGTRPFIPSSPFSPTVGVHPNSSLEGDRHFYRHGTYYKSEEYLSDSARFYSEIGHLSLPDEESIRRFIPADKVWPIDRSEWDYHAGDHDVPPYHPDRLGAILRSVSLLFGSAPDNLGDLVLASQIAQAEALKTWIERCRLRSPECSGILWWNMIDCWPQFSDAIVDYYGKRKLAYAYVQQAQQPACIIIDEPKDGILDVILDNDSRHEATGAFRVSDADTGDLVLEGSLAAPPRARIVLGQIHRPAAEQGMLVAAWQVDGEWRRNHYLAGVPAFDLDRYKAWLEAGVAEAGTGRTDKEGSAR